MKGNPYVDEEVRRQLQRRKYLLERLREKARRRLRERVREHYGGGKRLSPKQLRLLSIRCRSRASRIGEEWVSLPLEVPKGKGWADLLVQKGMVGYPVGAFVETRKQRSLDGKKKKVRR